MGRKYKRGSQQEKPKEPTRILYSPSWVVELGNCLYMADREGDFSSKEYARAVLDEYELYRKNFDRNSNERIYLEKLFGIAESVAQGKRRRREDYSDDFKSLTDERTLGIEEVRAKDKQYTHWIDSWLPKALSFSGGFCLTKATFDAVANYFDLDRPAVDAIGWWLSAGVATGVPSVLRVLQSKVYFNRLNSVESGFRGQRKTLRENLKNSMRDEYRLAIERSQHAWRESFGDLPIGEKTPQEYVRSL